MIMISKTVDDLKDDILEELFSYLDLKEKQNTLKVCQRWKDIIQPMVKSMYIGPRYDSEKCCTNVGREHKVPKKNFMTNYNRTMADVNAMEDFPFVRVLVVDESEWTGTINSHEFLEYLSLRNSSYESLECLTLQIGGISFIRPKGLLDAIQKNFPNIKHLTFSANRIVISSSEIIQFLEKNPMLEALHIEKRITGQCYSPEIFKHMKNLKELKIDEIDEYEMDLRNDYETFYQENSLTSLSIRGKLTTLKLANICFPNLTKLKYNLYGFDPNKINTMSNNLENFVNLTNLELRIGIGENWSSSILKYFKGCPLQRFYLDLLWLPQEDNDKSRIFTYITEYWSKLEELRIVIGFQFTNADLNQISKLSCLKRLVLSITRSLDLNSVNDIPIINIINNCRDLTTIYLRGFKNVTDSSLDAMIKKAKANPSKSFRAIFQNTSARMYEQSEAPNLDISVYIYV